MESAAVDESEVSSVPPPTVRKDRHPAVKAATISYRIELGAVLLAIAASGLFGVFGSRKRRRTRRRAPRTSVVLLLVTGLVGGGVLGGCGSSSGVDVPKLLQHAEPGSALAGLATLGVKGRAPKTGYARTKFGAAWADVDRNGCDTRDDVLRRDLTSLRFRASMGGCVVIAGVLADPYTGRSISFAKAAAAKVQIDHVVALSDAWQTGAQQLPESTRLALANDPLNLLAVDGPANQQKGDSDAATWLPPRKAFRCAYVSRQVAVKARYHLWVTTAERDAIARTLHSCPLQPLPV
jgi:hypothetical protein